jgi:hypothetical protein
LLMRQLACSAERDKSKRKVGRKITKRIPIYEPVSPMVKIEMARSEIKALRTRGRGAGVVSADRRRGEREATRRGSDGAPAIDCTGATQKGQEDNIKVDGCETGDVEDEEEDEHIDAHTLEPNNRKCRDCP